MMTIWNQIDAVLIINLDESKARWGRMMERLENIVPLEKVHRIPAMRGTNLPGYLQKPWFRSRTAGRAETCAGAAGCVLSHARALQYALKHDKWNTVLVLEDDAILRESKWRTLGAQLAGFLETNRVWEIVYLGYSESPKWAGETSWFNIFHCSGVPGTFSMLLHRRAWEKLLTGLPKEENIWSWLAQYRAIDYWLKNWVTPISSVYYITPSLVRHPDGEISDITGDATLLPLKTPALQLTEKEWGKKYGSLKLTGLHIRLQWDRLNRYVRARLLGFSGGKRASLPSSLDEPEKGGRMARIGDSCSRRMGLMFILYSFCLCLSFLFNIYLFRPDESPELSWLGWFSSGFLLAWLLLIAFKFKWLGFLFLPVLAFTIWVTCYVFFIFGAYINYEIVASMIEANRQEILPYCSWENILTSACLLVFPLWGVHYVHKRLASRITWRHLLIGGILYGFSLLCFLPVAWRQDQANIHTGYYAKSAWWPLADIRANYKRVKEYIKKGGRQFYEIMCLPSMAELPSRCVLEPQEEITLILHIGESVRADHLQINGYKRPTNPFLVHRAKNLVSFPDCHSFGLVTRVSLVGMLTDAEVMRRIPRYASFLDLFNKHGYETAAVLSRPSSIHDFPLEILTSSANRQAYISPCSGEGTGMFDSTVRKVREIEASMKGTRRLILFYDSGAHPFFSSFNGNKQWLPDSYPVNSPLEHLSKAVNAYDNNLLEIDLEIEHILKLVEHKNAVFIHVSDHGVALGEGGRFGQGNLALPVRKPAFFIWMSDQFIQRHQEKFRNLRANTVKPVSHDYLLHTLLSLAGIESSLGKKELDLTGESAVPFIAPIKEEILMGEQKNSW